MTFKQLDDDSLVEIDDETGLCKRVRLRLTAMDEDTRVTRDDGKAKQIEAKKESAYRQMVERTSNAWKTEPVALTPEQKPISGVENFVTGKGREGYIERTANAWKR